MATKRPKLKPAEYVTSTLPDVLTNYNFRCRRKEGELTTTLMFLAGDVDRYVQSLDKGNTDQTARELSNMRFRLSELRGLTK